MVELETVEDPTEAEELEYMIRQHAELTESPVAARILRDWHGNLPRFVRVMPIDYKRVLQERELELGQAAAGG